MDIDKAGEIIARDTHALLVRIADVMIDSYPCLGDDAVLSDDVALQRIWDALTEAEVDWVRAARTRREVILRQRQWRKRKTTKP